MGGSFLAGLLRYLSTGLRLVVDNSLIEKISRAPSGAVGGPMRGLEEACRECESSGSLVLDEEGKG